MATFEADNIGNLRFVLIVHFKWTIKDKIFAYSE